MKLDGDKLLADLDCQREIMRMQLYKEVYLKNEDQISLYAGNIARSRAEEALMAFDNQFKD